MTSCPLKIKNQEEPRFSVDLAFADHRAFNPAVQGQHLGGGCRKGVGEPVPAKVAEDLAPEGKLAGQGFLTNGEDGEELANAAGAGVFGEVGRYGEPEGGALELLEAGVGRDGGPEVIVRSVEGPDLLVGVGDAGAEATCVVVPVPEPAHDAIVGDVFEPGVEGTFEALPVGRG